MSQIRSDGSVVDSGPPAITLRREEAHTLLCILDAHPWLTLMGHREPLIVVRETLRRQLDPPRRSSDAKKLVHQACDIIRGLRGEERVRWLSGASAWLVDAEEYFWRNRYQESKE